MFNEIHQSAACDSIQKFYIRALQSAVRRERKPHETNILGYEPGRSTAGVTATLRQVVSKAAEWGVGAFVASADVEGAFDGIKHDDVEKALLQKGVHPESVCSLLRESSDLKGRISFALVLRCRLPFCTLVVLVRVARKALICGIRYWTTHSENLQAAGKRREWASCLPEKRRRGSSGDAVKDEGQVLHHSCWADDLYAMAGTMNHLTRILEDMTNAIERLGMRWKEKSLAIVAGPFTE